MTVYADVFVIVNLYIDFFLLWCVRRFLRLQAKGWRLVAGGLCGALCGLVSLFPMAGWASLLAGGAVALAASAAAFCPLGWRQLARAWLCLWIFSFLLAGVFLFLTRFLAPARVAVVGHAVYFDLSLPLLFLFTCLAYGVFWAFQRLFPRGTSPLRLCTLRIENQGAAVELPARADTGNDLREPFSGLPVVVCEAHALKNTAPDGALDFLADGTAPAGPSPMLRLVPFSTVGAGRLMPAFRADKVTLKESGQVLDCYVALSSRPLSSGQFAALFNPHAFEG